MADKPIFIEADADKIVKEMKAWYEAETGKVLQPAQIEAILINGYAYREFLVRTQINEASRQNLVDFAIKPILDFLGALVGVSRLPESPSNTTIEFTLASGHGSVVIPDGLRIGTTDGKFIFVVQEATEVDALTDTVQLLCVCSTPGAGGNGYIAGSINVILDPLPFLDSASNIDTSANGGDEETDEQLRDRIKLAPSSYSTAGSVGAYKFHAKSADPSIIDVEVTSPVPGQVNIYPLVEGGIATPAPIITAVEEACSNEKVRPLTDTVVVLSPSPEDYDIEVDITVLPDADNQAITDAVTTALQAFAENRKTSLGKDVLRSQIQALCMIENVYNTVVVEPASDLIIDNISFGKIGTITVNIVGINEG